MENNPFPEDVRVRDEAQSLVAAGYEVRVIAPRGPAPRPDERSLDGRDRRALLAAHVRTGGIGGLLAEYIVAHAQLFVRGTRSLVRGADFLHSHNPPDTLFPLAIAGRRLHRRFVFDQHDLFPSLFEERFGRGPLWRIADFANRMMIRNADLVLVTNRTHLEHVRGRRRPGTQIVLVRNGPRQSPCRRGLLPSGRAASWTRGWCTSVR